MALMKNSIGTLIIVIAVMVSTAGGFFWNGTYETTCETEFSYVTDIAPAFTGTGSDMEVEYTPQTNVTGYSVTEPGEYSSLKILGVEFTTASSNGYWVQQTTGDAVTQEMGVHSNLPDAELTLGEESRTVRLEPRLDSPHTYVVIGGGNLSTSGISVEALIGWYDGFSSSHIYLSLDSHRGYPAFVTGMSIRTESRGGSIFSSGIDYNYISYTDSATTVELNATTRSATVGGATAPWSEAYLLFRDDITVTIISGEETVISYIDPTAGVRPVPTTLDTVVTTTTDVHSVDVRGNLVVNSYTAGNGIGSDARVHLVGDSGDDIIEIHSYIYMADSTHYLFGIVWNTPAGEGRWDSDVMEKVPFFVVGSAWDVEVTSTGDIRIKLVPTGGIYFAVLDTVLPHPAGNPYNAISSVDLATVDYVSLPGEDVHVPLTSVTNSVSDITNNTEPLSLSGEGSGTLATVKKVTTTERVERTYTTTYWSNGYENSSTVLILSSDSPQSSYRTTMAVHSGLSSYTMRIVSYQDNWAAAVMGGGVVTPVDLGVWSAVALSLTVKDGVLTVSAAPCSYFGNYYDYSVMWEKAVTIASMPAGAKGVDLIEYTSDTVFPSHRIGVTETTVLLEGGGLYTQNGTFTMSSSFPNDELTGFRVMSAVRVGESMTVRTSGGESVSFTASEDGWIIDGEQYRLDRLTVYYASPDLGNTTIEGRIYEGGIYYEGAFYPKGHLYYSLAGGPLTDIGATDGGWSVTLDGTWAVSTAYYDGENTASAVLVMDDPGKWGWNQEEFLTVFLAVTVIGLIVCAWRFEMTVFDWVLPIGVAGFIYLILG